MRKIIIHVYLILFPFVSFSQRQTNGQSKHLIRFGSTTISILNNFITDSGRKVIPEFIQYPFSEEVFAVTGPELMISVSDTDSSYHPTGAITGIVTDTSGADKELFSLPNLQVRIHGDSREETSWQEVASFPVSDVITSETLIKNRKLSYILLNDTIAINETLSVEIRSRQKPDAVFRMRFRRTALPVMPFLAMMMHDSSRNTSEAEFIKRAVETGTEEFAGINSFYKDWPSKYGRGDNNQAYFSSSKLAFYFRRYDESYPDSSLEYALLTDAGKDTSWHRSGHLVLVTKLEAGKQYALLVRYRETPENIWQTHFQVSPEWYQTPLFYTATSFLAGIIIVFISFFLMSRRKLRREIQKREKLRLEQRAVRAQLNPHFTFNALSSIQSLMNQGRIEEANHYFAEFGSLLRHSLRNGEQEMLPLKEELMTLEQYMKLEQLRFRFHYEMSVSNDINTSAVDIPSLLLQPLIENAVKHGISSLGEKGSIDVTITRKEKNMKIHIHDNGSGFTPNQETNGYGLSLTKERIHLLNQSLKSQKININVDSDKSGTDIILFFLNWL